MVTRLFYVKTNICFPEEMKQGDVILCHPAWGWLSGFVPLPNVQNFNTLLEGIFSWWSLFGIIWKQKSWNRVIFNNKKYKLFWKFYFMLEMWRTGEVFSHIKPTSLSRSSTNTKCPRRFTRVIPNHFFRHSVCKLVLFWHSNHPHPLHYQFLASWQLVT